MHTQHSNAPRIIAPHFASFYAARDNNNRQPLRVLRVMDADQAPAQIGRLRISGRMADVCAELDRLAAHEAMRH